MTKYMYPTPGRERSNKVAREKMREIRRVGPSGRQYLELVAARGETCTICHHRIWPWQHYGFRVYADWTERWHVKCADR